MSDRDSDFDGDEAPSPVKDQAPEVSDEDVGNQAKGAGDELISDEEPEQNTEPSEGQATEELEGGSARSTTGEGSFQLGAEVRDQDVFGAGSDSDSDVEISAAIKAVTNVDRESAHRESISEEDSPPVRQKRQRLLSDSDLEETEEKSPTGPSPAKKSKIEDEESDNEGPSIKLDDNEGNQDEDLGEEASELQAELANLGGGNEEGVADMGGEEVVGGQEERAESDDELDDDRGGPSGMSDWDIMMQKRKDAMARARKRRKKDSYEVLGNDEHVLAMISQMKMAAEEDRHLNMEQKAATKKLQMLPTVVTHLKKIDLVSVFIDNDILSALSDWIAPLPDHSLPHLKIRESILDILKTFPVPDAHSLKHSKIGKAVMLLYRHPKETRRNREKAGKIINDWARPIFGLASDFKSLTRDEREERDYAHLSQSKRKRLSTGERRPSQDDEFEPQKPGDKGWVGRARVPMPSTNDYVVRPKWNMEQRLPKKSSKKVLNRYEKQIQKEKQRKMQTKSTHAVSISVEGRNMPL